MKKSLFTAFAIGLGLTASVMAQVPSYVPTNGLVGWWPFNGNANDESGNGNNGTVNGATLASDRLGNMMSAYDFVSGNRITSTPSLPLGNSQRTISVWFQTTSLSYNPNTGLNANSMVTYGNGPGTSGNGLASQCNFETLQGNITMNNYAAGTGADVFVSDGIWHHTIYTYDGLEHKLYLDNILIDSDMFSLNTGSTQLFFGGRASEPNSHNFNGKLDDIGIWNRALTQQEITDLFNSTNCVNDLTITPNINSIQIGNTANFTATTTDLNSTFTWQSDFGQGFQTLNDFGNYSGTNTNALSISNVQLANHNQPIRAISSNTNCTDTSNIATIQIADTCIMNVTVYDTLLTTVTDTLIINTTLSLPAPNNENTILIYPNPANDHITIDNGNYTAMVGYSIKIENNAGQQVFQSAINQQQFYVDLSTWTGNGLYFVHLIDAQNNTVTVRKIVLQ